MSISSSTAGRPARSRWCSTNPAAGRSRYRRGSAARRLAALGGAADQIAREGHENLFQRGVHRLDRGIHAVVIARHLGAIAVHQDQLAVGLAHDRQFERNDHARAGRAEDTIEPLDLADQLVIRPHPHVGGDHRLGDVAVLEKRNELALDQPRRRVRPMVIVVLAHHFTVFGAGIEQRSARTRPSPSSAPTCRMPGSAGWTSPCTGRPTWRR